jgi:beta-glucoside operon transcriptional antiterminator
MKAVRRINNNVIICLDDENNEVIARGKGIGFHELPYEIDLGKIERTYYNIDPAYYEMIRDIPDEIIDISTRIIDQAREMMGKLDDSNIIFTLADHINFSIRRYKENIPLKLPIVHDIQFLLKDEYRIGQYGLELIKKELGVYLPKDEAAYIALHIHEVVSNAANSSISEEEIIDEVTNIIEKRMEILINKDGFNYSRFVSHMYYLIRRKNGSIKNGLGNAAIYEKMVEEYPVIHEASENIAEYFDKSLNQKLSEEEKLYLMLHINRLCSRE